MRPPRRMCRGPLRNRSNRALHQIEPTSRAIPVAAARHPAIRMLRRRSRKRSAQRRTRTRSRPSIVMRQTPVGRGTAHPRRHPLTAATASAGRSRQGWTPRRVRIGPPRPSGNRHHPRRGSVLIHRVTMHLARRRRTTRTTRPHGASHPRRMRRRAGRTRARCRCNRPTRPPRRAVAIPVSSRHRRPHRTNRRAGRIPGIFLRRSRHRARYAGVVHCPCPPMLRGAGHSHPSSAGRMIAVVGHSRPCQAPSLRAVHTPSRPERADTTPPAPARSRRARTSAGQCRRYSGAASSPTPAR
jgi:hypothetical protein